MDYFILKVGNGDAFRLFEKSYQVLAEAGEDVRANARDSWNVAVEAKNKLAAMRAEGKSEAEQLAMIKDALRKMFQASERTSFDHTYELRDELIKAFIDKGSPHYANFTKDAMRELAKEGISYSEQSVSIKKLTNKLPEKMVMDARAGLQKEGLDTDMRFLPMVNTRLLGAAARTPQGKAAFDADIAALRELLKRADSMGIDVAGPEAQEFTPEGMANFRELYDVVREAALRRRRALVLRPHVGEGYVPKGEGQATGAHVELARRNLETMIRTLEEMGYGPARAAKDKVIIRFGHATHATPDQIARMAKLGVITEANIGSNLATEAIGSLRDHPLLYQLYFQQKTVLATDAQGVMGNTMKAEYARAQEIIDGFKNGDRALEINNQVRSWESLSAAERARFDIQHLKRWASEYRDSVARGDRSDVAFKTRSQRLRSDETGRGSGSGG